MPRSRIKHHLEKDTKRNFLLIAFGLGILTIIAVAVGPTLLIKFSVLVQNETETNAEASESSQLLAPPLFDELPEATNSASMVITGTALHGDTVVLYRNGKKIKETEIESDRVFRFIEVPLLEGENTFKAKALTKEKSESDFSDSVDVLSDIRDPELSVSEPPDGHTFKKEDNPIKVSGKTDPNTRVTINNLWARMDEEGNYEYSLRLTNGENQITIIAEDKAGNTSEKQIKVTLSE